MRKLKMAHNKFRKNPSRSYKSPAAQGMPLKIYLGCGPLPLSEQDIEILGNINEWILADKFVQDPRIKPWDAETLDQINDGAIHTLYSSHLLEHISHLRVEYALRTWHRKLQPQGTLILNVPDMVWLAEELLRIHSGQKPRSQHFTDIDGPYGILTAIYGSQDHQGEYHKAGFTEIIMDKLLTRVGFEDIIVEKKIDGHDMGILIVRANKA